MGHHLSELLVTYLIHRYPFTGINHDKWLVKPFPNATVDGNAKSEAPVDIHGLSMVYPLFLGFQPSFW
jgi:hypothetical protein